MVKVSLMSGDGRLAELGEVKPSEAVGMFLSHPWQTEVRRAGEIDAEGAALGWPEMIFTSPSGHLIATATAADRFDVEVCVPRKGRLVALLLGDKSRAMRSIPAAHVGEVIRIFSEGTGTSADISGSRPVNRAGASEPRRIGQQAADSDHTKRFGNTVSQLRPGLTLMLATGVAISIPLAVAASVRGVLAQSWAFAIAPAVTLPTIFALFTAPTLAESVRTGGGRVTHLLFGRLVLSDYPLADFESIQRVGGERRGMWAALIFFRGGRVMRLFGAGDSVLDALERELEAAKGRGGEGGEGSGA